MCTPVLAFGNKPRRLAHTNHRGGETQEWFPKTKNK